MAKSKPEPASNGGPNKTQMVVQALQELGAEAPPKEIQSHVLDKHGVELSTTMISSYKSNILKKQGGGGGGGRRGGGAAGAGGSVGLRDLATLRDLIDRVGAAELQQLIKVLAR